MSVTPMASALPRRADAEFRPILGPNEADLHMLTFDGKGRLALRGPASTMGWTPGQNVWLTSRDGGLLLSRSPHPTGIYAGAVVLDSRCRVLLPYFIRIQNNWEPGVRLMVLAAAPVEGFATAPTR